MSIILGWQQISQTVFLEQEQVVAFLIFDFKEPNFGIQLKKIGS